MLDLSCWHVLSALHLQAATDQMKRIYHYLDHPRELEAACPHSVEGLKGHILLLGCVRNSPPPRHLSAATSAHPLLPPPPPSPTQGRQSCYFSSQSVTRKAMPEDLRCWVWVLFNVFMDIDQLKVVLNNYSLLRRKASSNTAFVETLRRKHVDLKVGPARWFSLWCLRRRINMLWCSHNCRWRIVLVGSFKRCPICFLQRPIFKPIVCAFDHTSNVANDLVYIYSLTLYSLTLFSPLQDNCNLESGEAIARDLESAASFP